MSDPVIDLTEGPDGTFGEDTSWWGAAKRFTKACWGKFVDFDKITKANMRAVLIASFAWLFVLWLCNLGWSWAWSDSDASSGRWLVGVLFWLPIFITQVLANIVLLTYFASPRWVGGASLLGLAFAGSILDGLRVLFGTITPAVLMTVNVILLCLLGVPFGALANPLSFWLLAVMITTIMMIIWFYDWDGVWLPYVVLAMAGYIFYQHILYPTISDVSTAKLLLAGGLMLVLGYIIPFRGDAIILRYLSMGVGGFIVLTALSSTTLATNAREGVDQFFDPVPGAEVEDTGSLVKVMEITGTTTGYHILSVPVAGQLEGETQSYMASGENQFGFNARDLCPAAMPVGDWEHMVVPNTGNRRFWLRHTDPAERDTLHPLEIFLVHKDSGDCGKWSATTW